MGKGEGMSDLGWEDGSGLVIARMLSKDFMSKISVICRPMRFITGFPILLNSDQEIGTSTF